MKKRFWSLLLVLIMMITMIPATAYEAASARIGFYYAQGSPNGLIENTNMGFMTQIGDTPGPARQGFFYFEDKNGVRTRIQAKDLVSKNPSIIEVAQNKMNGDVTDFTIKGFGQTTLDYTVGGQTYSLNVNVALPPVGCSSSTTLSTSTYLTEFVVTETAKTFYIATNGSFKIDKINLQGPMASFATCTIDASKDFATVTITGTPDTNYNAGMYQFECEVSDATGQMTGMKMWTMIKLINGMESLNFCWPQWNQNTPVKPQSPMWQSAMKMQPDSRYDVYFSLVAGNTEKSVVTNIVSSNPNVVKVTTTQGSDLVRVEPVNIGTANLTYTDGNGKVYSIPVTVDLPEIGFYTSKTPAGNTMIKNGFVVNGVGDEFYLIARNGMTFNNVTLNGDFNNFATISWDSTKTIATITFTDVPDYFGEYSVYYEASNPNNGWNSRGDYWVGLINGQPHLEFVYSDDNGTNVFDSMWTTPGGQTEGWINYADANGAFAIPVDELKSTDESVIKISSANDPQNPDKIEIEFVGWGTAQIVYTDPNGKEYAFDVIADFDTVDIGFFTDNEMKKENYIPYEFVATNTNNVFYFMSDARFDIDNFKLLNDADKYAKLEVINKHCVKITITDGIAGLVAYGEDVSFGIEYEMHNNADGGTWTNHDGFELTYKMCKHTSTEVVGEKAATCTVKGYTGDTVCKVCKELTKKGTETPATGHTYVNGVCKDCGDKAVVADKVDKVDTTKPVQEVTPVIKQEAADTTAKDVSTVVDAILADNVTNDVKEAVSDETLKEIKNELEAGKQITTEIKAEVLDEKDIDADDVKEIKDKLGEVGKVAQFLDLSVMIKSVAADGAEKELGTLNVLSEKITFTIMVPEELVKDGREFYVIRVHDGEAEKLELTKNADGTYSFETDRFSSYALAYDETTNTNTNTNTTPVVPEIPGTGDTTNVGLYIVLLVMGCVALVFAKKKGFLVK